MRRKHGFTLTELLVVVGIIAILITMLMPTIGRAREVTRKAVCSANVHNLGVAVAGYVAESESYPLFGTLGMRYTDEPRSDDSLHGWPKIYGMLQANGMKGTRMTDAGLYYYGGPVDAIPAGYLCPSMDPGSILTAAAKAANFPPQGNFMSRVWLHKWAIGYQWSPFLGGYMPGADAKTPPQLVLGADHPEEDQYSLVLPVVLINGAWYYSRATHPSQLADMSVVAEAWDSWDIDSTPGIPWATRYCPRGQSVVGIGGQTPDGRAIGDADAYATAAAEGAYTPGWHGGVAMHKLRAMFNGSRHKSCPNILYADGHVASDARRPVDPVADGMAREFKGMWAYTWEEYDPTWGQLPHLVPHCRFLSRH